MAVVQPPVIVAPPTRPDRADRDTFADRADAWTIWERDHQVPEMGAVAANVAGNASDAAASAVAASASAGAVAAAAAAAANSASFAAGSATAAVASATASSISATQSGTRAADAEASRTAAVLAKVAAEASAANSLESRNQTQALRNEAQGIAAGDILGMAADKFSNNGMLPEVVRSTTLDGLTTGSAEAVVTSDSILVAAGKLQAQADRGITSISVISASTNAAYGTHYVLTASLVLTLPTPAGSTKQISFTNLSGTETASLAVINGGKIRGVGGPMIIDSTTASAVLTDSGVAQGWV